MDSNLTDEILGDQMRLRDRVKELQALADLQHTRTIVADKLWREAHPGNELVMPDLGALIDWLRARAEKAESKLAAEQGRTLHLRRLLWSRHGQSNCLCRLLLRGDDGELSCNVCGIDFRRQEPSEIGATWRRVARTVHEKEKE